MDKKKIQGNMKKQSTWLRGFYMLIFIIAYGIAETIIFTIVAFQFLASLIIGKPNERLTGFGKQLSKYIYHLMLYLTYNEEEKPFPFGEWPN